MIFSLGFGAYNLSIYESICIILSNTQDIQADILFKIRIPRIIMSSICGAMLALSGICLQAAFKNPLVGPNIIGVSSAAAFGGTLAIFFGFSTTILLLNAFIFGILALLFLYYIAKFINQSNLFSLILSGIVINGFFGALVSLIQYLADSEEKLPNIIFWLLGSFVNANYDKVYILILTFILAGGVLFAMRWRINLLSLSDDDMMALNVNPNFLRGIVLFFTTILISTQVSMSGNIGWVGLVVPHMSRLIAGADYSLNLPIAAISGAIFMLSIDTISRTASGGEIPLGVLTAIIGTPIFICLLRGQSDKT